MKILSLFSGKEFVLEDEELKTIINAKNSGSKAFLELRCGALVDTSAIESITGIPLVAYSADGHRLSKDERSFVRDGVRVWVENFEGIKYLPDKKYEKITDVQFKKLSQPNEVREVEQLKSGEEDKPIKRLWH